MRGLRKRYGRRSKGEKEGATTGAPQGRDKEKRARDKGQIDVVLLKTIKGVGSAGELVSVSRTMFESTLRISGKARLPHAHERNAAAAGEEAPSPSELGGTSSSS